MTTDRPRPAGPPLLVVGGPPASGKTTLAYSLAGALGLPLIPRDLTTEALTRALNSGRAEAALERSPQTLRLVAEVAGRHLAAGLGTVVEVAYPDLLSGPLVDLTERATVAIVHCHAPRSVLLSRLLQQAEATPGLPDHPDPRVIDLLLSGLETAHEPPPGPPLLRVDTSVGYDPPLDQVVGWAASNLIGG
jgi:predicted kinase